MAVDNVPDAVFGSLDNIRANVKYLTLYRYSGQALQDPCAVFPMLEELVIIRSDMSNMELKRCKSIRLRKLWIRNYTPKAVAVSVAPGRYVVKFSCGQFSSDKTQIITEHILFPLYNSL